MPITTVTCLPPEVTQHFNKMLLDPWAAMKDRFEKQMIRFLNKHKENAGILRDLHQLSTLFEELYEWHQKDKAYQRSENKKGEKKPTLQVSKIPLFPHELRDVYEKFVKSIR